MGYAVYLVALVGIFVILGLFANLLFGYGGVMSFAVAAFYGIGAYIYTLTGGGLPQLGAAFVGAAVLGWLTALLLLRLRGDYFILATIALQVIVHDVLSNWYGLTQGTYGIFNIPRPGVFTGDVGFDILILAVLAISLVAFQALVRSPFGLTLQAMRDDAVAATALGRDVFAGQVKAFAIAAGFFGLAGALYAGLVHYIDPSSFTLDESFLMLTMVILGGTASLWGSIAGPVILLLFPEALRFVGLPGGVAAALQQIIYGLLLIGLMLFRERGLFGRVRI